MSDIFFSELGIPAPDVNLDVGSGSHAAQTANIMLRFEPVCERERPDWVVVVGDVNSTLACTLVATKLGIKVAHVEAGLRSYDRTMPEEINRIVSDALADLLLTPSSDAGENLKREGVPESKIKLVGNIMIDTLVANLSKARANGHLGKLDLKRKAFAYVTLHRPSNVDNEASLRTIMAELSRLARQLPVVFPMHPRTRKMCEEFDIPLDAVGALKILRPDRLSRFDLPDGKRTACPHRLRRLAGGGHLLSHALPDASTQHRTSNYSHRGQQPSDDDRAIAS